MTDELHDDLADALNQFMERLRRIAGHLDHRAECERNGGGMRYGGPGQPLITAKESAGRIKDDAHAIRWAIREIEGLQAEVRAFKAAEVAE